MKTKNLPKVKPVMVAWVDSTGSSGWRDYEETPMECISIGSLVKKTKDRVVVAMNTSHHGQGEYMEIPLVAVKSIKKLK